jgi:hypothetical protein
MDLKQRILDASGRHLPGSSVIFEGTDERFLYFRIKGPVSIGSSEQPAYLALDLGSETEEKFDYVFGEIVKSGHR